MQTLTLNDLSKLITEHAVTESDFRAHHAGYRNEHIAAAAQITLDGLKALGFLRDYRAIATSVENAFRGQYLPQVPQGSLEAILLAQEFAHALTEQVLSGFYPASPAGHHWITSEVSSTVVGLIQETNSFVAHTDNFLDYWGGNPYEDED